jgi:hypothetical protein
MGGDHKTPDLAMIFLGVDISGSMGWKKYLLFGDSKLDQAKQNFAETITEFKKNFKENLLSVLTFSESAFTLIFPKKVSLYNEVDIKLVNDLQAHGNTAYYECIAFCLEKAKILHKKYAIKNFNMIFLTDGKDSQFKHPDLLNKLKGLLPSSFLNLQIHLLFLTFNDGTQGSGNSPSDGENGGGSNGTPIKMEFGPGSRIMIHYDTFKPESAASVMTNMIKNDNSDIEDLETNTKEDLNCENNIIDNIEFDVSDNEMLEIIRYKNDSITKNLLKALPEKSKPIPPPASVRRTSTIRNNTILAS